MRSGLLSRVVAFACRTHHSSLIVAAIAAGIPTPHIMGQEVTPQLGAEQEFRSTGSGRVQFYSRSGQETQNGGEKPIAEASSEKPQPYERTSQEAAVKNYYVELFGSQSQPKSGVVQTIPTSVSSGEAPIANAGYQVPMDDQQESSNIAPASHQETKTSELPAWARGMKSQSTAPEQAPATAEITPVSAQKPAPMLIINDVPTEESAPQSEPTAPVAAQVNRTPVVNFDSVEAGPQTPSVKIEWKSLQDINVGQECQCELVVSNVGESDAYGVSVEANFPLTARLLKTSPEPESATDSLVWTLGTMKADSVQTIKLSFIPSERGNLAATAHVHFTGATQSAFVVREPLLGLDMQGPDRVMVGEPASHSVSISNPGNGIAKNVQLEALIPAGLEHTRGERLIMNVGSLNPGETRTIRLALAAVAGGHHTVDVAATADGGLVKSASSSIEVIAPSLLAEIDGPGLRYKGRSATYTVKVKNDGTVATSNVRLMHKVPNGFKFVSASRGATYDEPTRILSWFVGRLDAGKSAEMSIELNAEEIGEFVHYIRATSEHGSTSDQQLLTRVEGTSALMLEITDLDDPVEMGRETAYEIKVTNEGSAAARNVGLTCELPEGVQFLKAEGPSNHVTEGNLVMFKPLEGVGAGKTVKYRVHVVGNVDGNLRFRARMTSAASQEPLTFEELTRFYGDQR